MTEEELKRGSYSVKKSSRKPNKNDNHLSFELKNPTRTERNKYEEVIYEVMKSKVTKKYPDLKAIFEKAYSQQKTTTLEKESVTKKAFSNKGECV